MPNQLIHQITVPVNGVPTTLELKDAQARQDILDIQASITGGMHFLGETSTEISDGSSPAQVVVGSITYIKSGTPGEGQKLLQSGDIVIYGELEFIWSDDAQKWKEFGSTGSLKALAFKDTASADYTPAGTVSQPTFTGTEATLTDTDVAITGTVSQPTFSGTEGSVSVTGTPTGSVTVSVGSGTANYTPAGTVSQPTATVTPSSDSITGVTSAGTASAYTLPSWTATVDSANETLAFTWDAGTYTPSVPPTLDTSKTFMTGATVAVSQPTFSGTGVDLEAAFSGSSLTSTGAFTPAGTVSQPTFTGDDASVSITYTPAGTVAQPTFNGTQATITVS